MLSFEALSCKKERGVNAGWALETQRADSHTDRVTHHALQVADELDEDGNEVYNIFESFKTSSRSTTATAHLKVRMEVWWLFRRARRRDDLLGAPKCTFECNTCEWTEWTEWTYTSMNYSYSLHCLRPISQ